MGWGYGVNAEGREVGYSVEATCDEPGCEEKIDRGLGYVCGNMHDGGEWGCGGYFCSAHLFRGGPTQMCKPCMDMVCALGCASCEHDLEHHFYDSGSVLDCRDEECNCSEFLLKYEFVRREVAA